jgi:hypothetical protein
VQCSAVQCSAVPSVAWTGGPPGERMHAHLLTALARQCCVAFALSRLPVGAWEWGRALEARSRMPARRDVGLLHTRQAAGESSA